MGINFTTLLVIVFITIVLTLWLVGFLARLNDRPKWMFWTIIILCGSLLIYLVLNLFQIIPKFIYFIQQPPIEAEILSQDEVLEEAKKRIWSVQAFYTNLLLIFSMALNIAISFKGLKANGADWSKLLGWVLFFETILYVLLFQLL